MKILLTVIFSILVLNDISAQTERRAYLPLSAREMSNTFPVEYAGTYGERETTNRDGTPEKSLPKELKAGISVVSFAEDETGDFIISGRDKSQRNWTVNLGNEMLTSTRFYTADLDKNGFRDLLLLIPTGGNGLAPSTHLLSLTFDATGRPVPFRADGYFEDRGGRIYDLVDIDRDGRAELLYMNHGGGYWTTNFYRAENARWQKVSGKLGNRSYPLYVRFTTRPNYRAVTPKKGLVSDAPDLSNASAILRGKLSSFAWANVNQSEDITLKITTSNGKIVSASPVSWSSTFFAVLDSAEGRKIVSLGAGESMKEILNEIVARKCAVEVYGRRDLKRMSPELLWAKAF